MSSPVMDTGNGIYLISAHAAPIRGGEVGAQSVAYSDANKFCAQKGMHAVVVDSQGRDIYQGSLTGGVFVAGNVDMRFRCSVR